MGKFTLGQKVALAFNAAKADEKVPNQANGRWPGSGNYQTKPHTGVVEGVTETADGFVYLVGQIDFEDGRGPTRRTRHVREEKLSAL